MLRRWWTASDRLQLLESERNLLAKLVRHPFHKPSRLQEEGNDDRKGGGGRELNLVEFRAAGSPSSPSLPTVVIAHGFGSGLSFFYRNVDDLLDSGKIGRVILVDWLGMGGSARPPCWESPVRSLFSTATTATTTETTTSRKFSLCNSEFSPSSAIDFFLDPFDRMMRNKELFDDDEPVWLIGHSLGGYLAGMYAMRQYNNMYNNDTTKKKRALNLTKLILLSPVGFRPQPTSPQRTRIASSTVVLTNYHTGDSFFTSVHDNNNGTYTVSYTPAEAGLYFISATVDGFSYQRIAIFNRCNAWRDRSLREHTSWH